MTGLCHLPEEGVAEDGWLPSARRIDSPNFDERPQEMQVSLVVVHAISLPPAKYGSDDIIHLFTNTLDPAAHPYFSGIFMQRVSAHFLIRRDGELIQFVSCRHRAWHAGVSTFHGRERCNDFSMGIELEGSDDQAFAEAQYVQLQYLAELLCARYPIEAVAGHCDISPGRKTDPGPFFDWQRLFEFSGLQRMRSGG
jgi:AmpD protein